jgi:haloalkane dehalogenase
VRVLRTPDERFARLPGYPFAPRFVEVTAPGCPPLSMHVVDEGPRDADPVLLLHGEPTWSYLYRRVIPPIVRAGFRAVAPDLVGFGRSEKRADRSDHTYDRHVAWTRALVEALELERVTLVCHDWGGLIGLRVLAELPERFDRVVATNTGLPTGDQDLGEAFRAWRRFSQEAPELPVGRIVAGGCLRPLAPEVVAAYDAPFPDES